MERSGIKALMDEIDAGRVDVIVFYKVDRLTRSLADFAAQAWYPLQARQLVPSAQEFGVPGHAVHKDNLYPGEHQPIVDGQLWDAVQAKLAQKASPRRRKTNVPEAALLQSMITNPRGRSMVPTYATLAGDQIRGMTRNRLLAADLPMDWTE